MSEFIRTFDHSIEDSLALVNIRVSMFGAVEIMKKSIALLVTDRIDFFV